MMKELVRTLDVGILPEIGLIAFVVAFVLIIARVLLIPKRERDWAKNLPLQDSDDFFLETNHD